jgi:hypothetical protein
LPKNQANPAAYTIYSTLKLRKSQGISDFGGTV